MCKGGPDGLRVVRIKCALPGRQTGLSPGDHVELVGDAVRWYEVLSCDRCGFMSTVYALRTPAYAMVLRASTPEGRLAWEVMSS